MAHPWAHPPLFFSIRRTDCQRARVRVGEQVSVRRRAAAVFAGPSAD